MAEPRRARRGALSACAATLSALLALAVPWLSACDQRDRTDSAAFLTGGDPATGKSKMRYFGCASCHTIPGVPQADGSVGPSLAGIRAKPYIGGVLVNSPENLIRWLLDPPSINPHTAMPSVHLKDQDARDIASYLYSTE
jgi:cytochrome c